MISVPSRRSLRLTLAAGFCLLVIVSVTLTVAGLGTPGYAGGSTSNPILEALLQRTPTPIPTPVQAACGVRIAPRTSIATATVGIELWNEGAAAALQAITLAWPASNGNLVELRIGDRPVWAGEVAGGSATVFPGTAEMVPTIKAGERTGITLRFSRGASDGQYIVLLHLGKSCYALLDTSQTASADQSCYATFDRFSVNEQAAALAVRNTTKAPLDLGRLLIFWSNRQGTINSVQINGAANLIPTPSATSPIDIILSGDSGITLEPDETARVRLLFDRPAPLVGYTIALQASECQSVFSNVVPPSECPVRQAGDLQVVGETAGMALQNLGETSQPFERIWLTFPETNQALIDVVLNGSSIVDRSSGLFPKISSPTTMTAGIDLLPDASLPPNSQSTVAFVFEQDAASEHYTAELAFSDECRVLTTTRVEEAVPCQVEVDGESPLRAEGNQVRLAIRNTGGVQAELQALQIDWPSQFNGALRAVTVGEVPFWEGERTEGTATVTHNTDNTVPPIEPGQSVEVGFTFDNEAVAAPYAFRLEFAEGCRLLYSTQADGGMPPLVQYRGTIYQLPANAFDGIWVIRLHGDEMLSVRVMPPTVIEPAGLTPRRNDFVVLRALPSGDDYLATYIRVTPNAVEPIQLNGRIDQVGPGNPPTYILVQSTTVDIVPETTIQGTLAEGWHASVDGLLRADGISVLARRITTRQPDAPPVDISGLVAGWQQTSDTEALWIIDSGMRIVVKRDETELYGIEWGERPHNGVRIWVTGRLVSARAIKAEKLWYGSDREIQEFSGTIRKLPAGPSDSPFEGPWTIEDSAIGTCDLDENPDAEACKEVLVTDSTFVDVSEAPPAVGAPVQVRAQVNLDGNLEALWIKVLPDED